MKGIIWNCRGVSKKGMSAFLKDLIWDYSADFVGIQEIKNKNYIEKFFIELDLQKNFLWHWIAASGKSGGMLSGTRCERLDLENFEGGDFVIIVNVFDKKLQKNWDILANVYGPAQKISSFMNWETCVKTKYPLHMGGDFNILRFSDEKNKKFAYN